MTLFRRTLHHFAIVLSLTEVVRLALLVCVMLNASGYRECRYVNVQWLDKANEARQPLMSSLDKRNMVYGNFGSASIHITHSWLLFSQDLLITSVSRYSAVSAHCIGG